MSNVNIRLDTQKLQREVNLVLVIKLRYKDLEPLDFFHLELSDRDIGLYSNNRQLVRRLCLELNLFTAD